MDSQETTTPCTNLATAESVGKLLKLPPELRCMVYSAIFAMQTGCVRINPSPSRLPPEQLPSPATNLLLTSHAIYDEAIPSFLQETSFRLKNPDAVDLFLQRYTTHRHHVRRIILDELESKSDHAADDMLREIARNLPNLRVLCCYYTQAAFKKPPKPEGLETLIPAYFTSHSIAPEDIYILDPEKEQIWLGCVHVWSCLRDAGFLCWNPDPWSHEIPTIETLDRITNRVREAICESRGADKTCLSMLEVRRQGSKGVFTGESRGARKICGVLMEMC